MKSTHIYEEYKGFYYILLLLTTMPPKFKSKKKEILLSPTNNDISEYPDHDPDSFLIIVESPSKCKKIESFLGSKYKCIATKGHLRTIHGLKSIRKKPTFEITFTNIEGKEEHIEWMKRIISKYVPQNVYIGTDDDREGMAIGWHICILFGLSVEHTPRIVFNEITKTALENAVKNPSRINMNIVHAQNARQVLDMYVGFKISPYLWRFLYSNKSAALSAGRCQTPALRLVYENQCEIDTYLKNGVQTKYKIQAYFFGKNLCFDLMNELDTFSQVEEFLEKSKSFSHTLSMEPSKESISSPPKPLSTSRLLQVASNQLSLSPKQTMEFCQILYQSGYITYMRTDSLFYSKEYLEKARSYIVSSWGESYLGNIDNIENKNANNPHEAIRATNLEIQDVNSDNTKLCSLYKLIWRTSIESCMAPSIIECIPAIISAPEENIYKYIVEIPKFMGWKCVKTMTEKQAHGSGLLLYLQSIEKSKSKVLYNKIEATVKLSAQKPTHYTEASLIQKLEDLGIGRPSTFSSIIETIQDRGYVEKKDVKGETVKCIEYVLEREKPIEKREYIKTFGNENNKLVIQHLGLETIRFLTKYFNALFSYEYTKHMEDKLDKIALDENVPWYSLCEDCANEIKQLSQNIAIGKKTYPLEDGHELCFQKYGPVIRIKKDIKPATVPGHNEVSSSDDEVKDTHDDMYEYKSIKKNIELDLEKLSRGEYTLNQLVETPEKHIGHHEDKPVYLKNGKFGAYIEWGDKRFPCKDIPGIGETVDIDSVSPEIIIQYLKNECEIRHAPIKNMLRVIDNNLSIRKGKYGPYVFYKTPNMKDPVFYSMSKFKTGYMTCEPQVLKQWLIDVHGANIE